MKIPLKNKIFAWYLHRGVILTKDNLIKRNWHGSPWCVFCHHDDTIKHLFFQCKLARSIWSVIQIASGLYSPSSVVNIFGNGYMRLITCLELFLGWERLPLFGRFGYVEMIRFLTIKVLPYAGYLHMYWDSSFMALSTSRGESRPVYEGVYTIGGYGEGYFCPAWVAAWS